MAVTEEVQQQVSDQVAQLLEQHPPASTARHDFLSAQFDAGLAWAAFPRGEGGQGLPHEVQREVFRLLEQAGAPNAQVDNRLAYSMGAPSVQAWGTDEQRQRYLRPLFLGERWCQLFSEPGAGSDLASVATRAVRDGDGWVINGQKVWTSMAELSQRGMLLARTDPSVPKHKGLTYFVLDMSSPGVEIRPLRQMTGEAEFSEVYLNDVWVPDTDRLGPVDGGWKVALSTLMNERDMFGTKTTEAGPVEVALRLLEERQIDDPGLRSRLLDLWVRGHSLRLYAAQGAARSAAGDPGPEGSLSKVGFAELNKSGYELCLDLMGDDALLFDGYDRAAETAGSPPRADTADPRLLFLRSRANSIEGGTTEIMRNIIGERVLGLPAEPRVDKDVPYSRARR
jgi:alkylation response protein AidB-like acyl-CoA dehydrogenase